MRIRSSSVIVLACVLGAGAIDADTVLAQSVGRVTPESFAPQPGQSSGPISIPSVEPGIVPQGAETLSVKVGDIAVEGARPELSGAIDAAIARVKGKTVTVKALYEVAAEIEAAYSRAGYVLTRVTVPPQKLDDGGTFKLIVLEGFIESIDVSRVPERQRAAVRAHVAGLVGRRGLTMVEIERSLLLAGEVPGISLRSALTKGEQTGGACLVLEADYRPVSVSIGADNMVGSAYNSNEFPIQGTLNDVLGWGETLYGSAITGPDVHTLFGGGQPVRRVYGLGALLPLGVDGLMINPELTVSNTNPRQDPGTVRTRGEFDRFALRANYPLLKTRAHALMLTGSFEVIDEIQKAPDFATNLNEDKLRIVTLGLESTNSFSGNRLFNAGVLFTQGLRGLGARDQAEATASGIPLTRQGSQPDYSKMELHGSYDQPLGNGFDASLVLRGQEAFSGAMPSAAQFSLDGTEALSSFTLGTLNVDSGATARGSLTRPFNVTAAAVIAPYVFAASGAGSLVDPTAVEKAHVGASSYGVGVHYTQFFPATGTTSIASVEIGRAHANIVAEDQTRVMGSWTFKY